MRRTAIALFCLFLLSVGIGLRAQNIQLHYDFGRSLYDKDLKDRPVLTSTVEKFHPDKWGSTYFFVDMDYTSDGVAAAYWEIARELKFWKNPFSVHVEYNEVLPKVFLIRTLIWGELPILIIILLSRVAFHCRPCISIFRNTILPITFS